MKRFNPYLSGLIIALFAIVSCSQNQPGSGGSSLSNLPAGIITIKSNNGDQIAVGSRYTINNNEWNSQYASAPSSENVFMGSNKGSMYFWLAMVLE